MRIEPEGVLWSAPEAERSGRPLLVMLHGHGMNERIGFELRHQLPAELVLASLRGPLSARGGYGWFPLEAVSGLAQLSGVLEAVGAAVDAVLAWLDEQADHPSVGLLGFSQGSAVVGQCLRERPSSFAYAVLLSGFVSPLPSHGDEELARRRPPVFSGRGAADRILPAPLVTITEHWLRGHTTLTSRTYPGLSHNVSAEEIADLAEFLEAQLGDRR